MQMFGQTSSLSDCQGPAASMCFGYPDKATIFPFTLQAWSELQNCVWSQRLTSCVTLGKSMFSSVQMC